MRFLVDAQLPIALARWLASAGHQAEHVSDLDLLEASDSEIWSSAQRTGSVIVTKDEDFQVRSVLEETGPAILWIRLGNTRNEALLTWFEEHLPGIERSLERGDRVVELS